MKEKSERQLRRRTIVAFSIFVLAAALMFLGWRWFRDQPLDNGLRGAPKPVRKVLDINKKVFKHTLSDEHLAKTFPEEKAASKARLNGDLGLGDDFNIAGWQLHVIRTNGDTLNVTLADLKKLPKTAYTFDFKCIEGWSQISNWGGVRLSTFLEHYGLDKEMQKAYVGLSTPDKGYYVGIDMQSALHPQTILCYELNGQPLPLAHGAPLRLLIPVKYGVKSLKRIGTIYFSDTPPPDYWAERGYDYYLGL